jgi:hypothetical protein
MASAHIELTRDIGGNRHQYAAAEAIDSLNQALAQIRQVSGVINGYLNGGTNADVESGFGLNPGQGAPLAFAFSSLLTIIDVATIHDILNNMG